MNNITSDILAGLALIVSVISILAVFWAEIRRIYVDVVVRARLESVDERRQVLRDLCYYTDPKMIDMLLRKGKSDEKEKYIRTLLRLQSDLEHRLLNCLYPDQKVMEGIERLVAKSIEYIGGEDKPDDYEKDRGEYLERLKIYNFASWQYAQNHSTGKKGSSVHDFDKAFQETLNSLEQDTYVVNDIMGRLKKVTVLTDTEADSAADEEKLSSDGQAPSEREKF